MRNRTIRLTAAAVVGVAVLAIGVETFRPNKPDKTYSYYAFSARIQAEMPLDLDPGAANPFREARPGDFDVTWSGENGGMLKVMPGSLVRIRAVPLIRSSWGDVLSWSYSHLTEIRQSTTTSVVPTEESPFVAILTSEGNLAAVQVSSRTETSAWLRWQVGAAALPGYGAVQSVTLQSLNETSTTPQRCAIDLDTGQIIEIPTQVLRMPADSRLAWLKQHGIDAIARVSDEGDGLIGVDLVFCTWMPSEWADTDPADLREEMTHATAQPREPLLFRGDRYQSVFPFKTREGAIGMLQLLAVDDAKRTVQFRYRLLQEDAGNEKAGSDVQSEQLAQSIKRLMRFGLLACIYADHHDGKYPMALEDLKDLAEKEQQDHQWIVDNVEYVGAGKSAHDPNPGSTVLAYDRTLLQKGKGTHAVFRDSHAEFIEPGRLSQYGIPAEPQGARTVPPQ